MNRDATRFSVVICRGNASHARDFEASQQEADGEARRKGRTTDTSARGSIRYSARPATASEL